MVCSVGNSIRFCNYIAQNSFIGAYCLNKLFNMFNRRYNTCKKEIEMTKKEIKRIQELESSLLLEVKKNTFYNGADHLHTTTARARWATCLSIMEMYSIKQDFDLPDTKEAYKYWKKAVNKDF